VLVYQWAGFPRNYVRLEHPSAGRAASAAEVAAAVRAGRVQVTSGPFVSLQVAGGEPGDLVAAADGRIQIDVEVRAAGWIDVDAVEIWINGELAAEGALAAGEKGGVRGSLSLRLPVARDSWVVAIVRGDRPLTEVLPWTKLTAFALTNPVFVDADGDGRFTALRAGRADQPPDAGPDVGAAGSMDAGAAIAP
jgi:hypothetical protein